MNREETNNAGMFSGPVERDGLKLYPMTMGLRGALFKRGNPLVTKGDSDSPMHQNELLFCFCHDAEDIMRLAYSDEWEEEVTRFCFKLGHHEVKTIMDHFETEMRKWEASETTNMPGKPKGKARPG